MTPFLQRWLPGFLLKQLEGRPNLQKIAANTGWLLADRILRMAGSLVVNIFVARHLGPDQFGLFSFALAFTLLFSPIIALGLEGIVVRDMVQRPLEKKAILATAFVLKLTAGLFVMPLALLTIYKIRPDDPQALLIVGILSASAIFQAADAIDFWFQSQVKSRYSVMVKSTVFSIVSIGKIILVVANAPLIAFVWATLAETVITAFGFFYIYRYTKENWAGWQWRPDLAQRLLHDSWPLMISGLAVMIFMKFDQIMLGQFAGTHAVGLYSAATRTVEVFHFVAMAIASSVTPSIIAAKQSDGSLYLHRMQQLFTGMAAISICIAVPLTLFSNAIIHFLYGNEFSGASIVLSIQAWSVIFVFLGVAQWPWTLAEGLTRLAMQRSAIGAAANIGLNFFLIPKLGLVGAALSSIITQALVCWLLNLINFETRIIFRMQLKAFIPMNVRAIMKR